MPPCLADPEELTGQVDLKSRFAQTAWLKCSRSPVRSPEISILFLDHRCRIRIFLVSKCGSMASGRGALQVPPVLEPGCFLEALERLRVTPARGKRALFDPPSRTILSQLEQTSPLLKMKILASRSPASLISNPIDEIGLHRVLGAVHRRALHRSGCGQVPRLRSPHAGHGSRSESIAGRSPMATKHQLWSCRCPRPRCSQRPPRMSSRTINRRAGVTVLGLLLHIVPASPGVNGSLVAPQSVRCPVVAHIKQYERWPKDTNKNLERDGSHSM